MLILIFIQLEFSSHYLNNISSNIFCFNYYYINFVCRMNQTLVLFNLANIIIIILKLYKLLIIKKMQIVTKLTLLANLMIQWNIYHEFQFQLKLIWHHMISWFSWIHNINFDWFVSWIWISETVYKLYEAMSTTLTRLIIWSCWKFMQFRVLFERYSFNLSKNVYNF